MKCPNCRNKFPFWKSFKLSYLFRVVCSSCSEEVVKDTAGFEGYRSTILSVMLCVFLTVLFFDRITFWGFIFLFPVQLYFDNFYARLRSLGNSHFIVNS